MLDAYGITAEIHQPDDTLEPWADIRYGQVSTHVEIRKGVYTAFSGMPQGAADDPDGAARRIASLCGVPGVPAIGPP